MVSLQPSISTKERSTNWFTIFGDKSKKRKLEDNDINGEVERGGKELNLWWCTKPSSKTTSPVSAAAVDDIELQLEDSPLPPEWQRCLDIKSGRIHFYNTRTNKRTTKDPRCLDDVTPPPTSRANVTIDLELNLGFESPITNKDRDRDRDQEQREEEEEEEKDVDDGSNKKRRRFDVTGGGRKPPEVAEHREMVAAVCIRCHMLVMMCKSSPSCPNCKYLHETTSPTRRV